MDNTAGPRVAPARGHGRGGAAALRRAPRLGRRGGAASTSTRESELIWLEADTIIRQESGGKKSLDDFARAFHGAPGGGPAVKTYTYDDVVATLNAVAPYDWNGFFEARVRRVAPRAPLGGIENGGWKLVYTDVQPELLRATEEQIEELRLFLVLARDRRAGRGGIGQRRGRRDPRRRAGTARRGGGRRPGHADRGRQRPALLREGACARRCAPPRPARTRSSSSSRTSRPSRRSRSTTTAASGIPHLERDASKPDLLSAIGKPLAPVSAK